MLIATFPFRFMISQYVILLDFVCYSQLFRDFICLIHNGGPIHIELCKSVAFILEGQQCLILGAMLLRRAASYVLDDDGSGPKRYAPRVVGEQR